MRAIVLALPLLVTASVISRRDRLEHDSPHFAEERKDRHFNCHYRISALTGVRSFWCPSPCRLNDESPRKDNEAARPQDWVCPPTVANEIFSSDELCRWSRHGRLSCPSNCNWELNEDDSYDWRCHSREHHELHVQAVSHEELGWASRAIDQVELEIRSLYLCPGANELACPITSKVPTGLTVIPSGSFECANVTEDLSNCGSCSIGFGGSDCTAIPHAKISTCSNSRCVVQRCARGFKVSLDGSKCVKAAQ